MMFKRLIVGLIIFAAAVMASPAAQAVPSLGVGAGDFNCAGATEYWECFGGNLGGHGFALPASGQADGITLWSNITGADIWLLAEPSIDSFTFTFNGQSSGSVPVTTDGAFDSYDTPYLGINLGPVNGSWFEIDNTLDPNNVFNPGTFYGLTGTLTYTGTNVTGDWFFLVADDNGTSGLQGTGPGGSNDPFSPKTTGAVGVPEPSTLFLLGGGLLALALYGRRKFGKYVSSI